MKTVMTEKKGTDALADLLIIRSEKLIGERKTKRRSRILNEISTNAYQMFLPVLYEEAGKLLEEVLEGRLTPYEAAEILGN